MNAMPDRCAVALKEWSGVCAALAAGRQTLLLRKGGIREREGQFLPEHEAFWLYPTRVHQAQQGLRVETPDAEDADQSNVVRIDCLARVQKIAYVDRKEILPLLEEFHVWTPETIDSRFAYRRPGLWAMAVRVFRRPEPWTLIPTGDQLGCQSWVQLEEAISTEGLLPVLEDEAAEDRLGQLEEALRAGRGRES